MKDKVSSSALAFAQALLQRLWAFRLELGCLLAILVFYAAVARSIGSIWTGILLAVLLILAGTFRPIRQGMWSMLKGRSQLRRSRKDPPFGYIVGSSATNEDFQSLQHERGLAVDPREGVAPYEANEGVKTDEKIRFLDLRIPWNDGQESALTNALGYPANTIPGLAQIIAQAGALEVLAMAMGAAVPRTMTDLRPYRIFRLIEQGITLPEAETLVEALFKVTHTTAKRYVNEAVARYRVELQASVSQTICRLLEEATWSKEHQRWEVRLPGQYVQEKIRAVLGELTLPDPERAHRGSLWRFPEETYRALRQHYGLPERLRETR